jgi:hypothetical protein
VPTIQTARGWLIALRLSIAGSDSLREQGEGLLLLIYQSLPRISIAFWESFPRVLLTTQKLSSSAFAGHKKMPRRLPVLDERTQNGVNSLSTLLPLDRKIPPLVMSLSLHVASSSGA